MLEAIVFALTIVLPNLILMGLGFFMRRQGQISKGFINDTSKLVFNYALPCLLFFSVIDSTVEYTQQLPLLAAGLIATLILFFGAEVYAKRFISDPKDKGVFVQGVFRSNMAIIGLATITNAYGSEGLGIGAVYMGILTLVYNILAVITLGRVNTTDNVNLATRLKTTASTMLGNPLIITLILAFSYQALNLPPITGIARKTADLLAVTALPLALICAGATLDVRVMLNPSGLSMQASIGRIVIAPFVAVAVGLGFGLAGVQMGVLFLMVASPAAAASYVMAKAMGGNDILAANILAFTTVVSLFGMAIGAGVLRGLGMM